MKYIVFMKDDSSVILARDVTLRQAAETLLTTDSYEFEVVTKKGLVHLYRTKFSTASCHSKEMVLLGGFISRSKPALWRKVIAEEWNGAVCYGLRTFRAMENGADGWFRKGN